MKKIVFLLSLMFCATVAWAQNTIDVTVDGWTLRCSINGDVATVVEYTHNGTDGYLTIPDAVTNGDDTYPVTSIGASAFDGCSSLSSITIPSSVTSIGNYAFYSCTGLTSITLPSSLTSIGEGTFRNCNLTSIAIPNSVTVIGSGAFQACGLESVTFDGTSTLTSIGDNAFDDCSSLTSIAIPGSVASIGDRAFRYCTSLTSLTIPNSVTSIGNYAFFECSGLTSVTLPNSVTSIGNYAFCYCTSLKSIVIPGSMNNIGDYAIYGCSNLKTVFNYSGLGITAGQNFNGATPDRVITGSDTTMTGEDCNALVKVREDITTIPQDHLPVNYIAKVGSEWKANDIVLTDCKDAFNAPVGFTATSVTYTRTLTDGNRSTLCLPFTTTIPDDLVVYDFTSFDANTIHFTQKESGNIEAYTPYLVGKDLSKSTTDFTFTQTNVVFTATPASMTPVTHNEMTFRGVMERTTMTSTNNYGYKDGYFVRSGGSAHVNPFRCYFTWNNAPQNAPQNLGIDTDGGGVGIEEVEADAAQNGRIRYSNDVYDLMGRMVRKEASDLRGLPKGIYIWRGKKILNY